MVKKGALILLIILTISSLHFITSQDSPDVDLDSLLNESYTCLEGKVRDKCSSLNLDTQIFSLLALNYDPQIRNECKDAILQHKQTDCFSKTGSTCNLKSTAIATLALNRAGQETTNYEDWLFSQNGTPTDLNWYLQIDSNEVANCNINYGSTGQVTINEDKTLSGNPGSCLSIDSSVGNYWLRISPSCYDREFEISCDKSFITSLLYRKQGSSTIYVPDLTHESGSGSSTYEKISSKCFTQGSSCDYEGSLWSAFVLNSLGRDISPYLPYLISYSQDNEVTFPETFLFQITSSEDYLTKILESQRLSDYWDVSGDKYYDSSLAALALSTENYPEFDEAKDWILSDSLRDSTGCWKTDTLNNAFILYSFFERVTTINPQNPVVELPLCEENGNYCRPSHDCSADGGSILENFACPGIQKCCSIEPQQKLCSELGGVICDSLSQECQYRELNNVAGLSSTELCCSTSCIPITPISTENECESEGGTCKSSCSTEEESKSYSCSVSSDICCVSSTTNNSNEEKESSFGWLIWVLLILIILVILAIIFREKLRPFWMKIQSKFHKGNNDSGGFSRRSGLPPRGMPPRRPGLPPRGIPLRKHSSLTPPRKSLNPPSRKNSFSPSGNKDNKKDIDEVMKRLKDIGK